jgi:hypothetical protein
MIPRLLASVMLFGSIVAACGSDDLNAGPSGKGATGGGAGNFPDSGVAGADASAGLGGGAGAGNGPDSGVAGAAASAGLGGGSGHAGSGATPGDAGPVACGVKRVDVSSPPKTASWRYGGGVGYPDLVLPTNPCTTVVKTAAELSAALAAAKPNDVVYVADDARIDLSQQSLCIPEGVTLASGRGRNGSPGGLLFVTVTESKAMLRACGDDVRITGLRLQGWEPDQCPPEWPNACTGTNNGINCRDCMPRSRGVQAKSFDRLEVDNSDLSGWTYGAIELVDSLDNVVHHNYIHHNQRQGLGYGVVLSNVTDPATVLIEYNRFDYNRHSVAGSGAVGQSYEARHNLALTGANGHVFDMHGIDEAKDDGTPWAGTRMLIHNNTVLADHVIALVVRGRPTEGSWLYANCLARNKASDAAQQTNFLGNFWVDQSPTGNAPNAYGQSASDCETVRFCSSGGAQSPWRYLAASGYGLSSLGFGDFDGDGKTDVFRPDGSAWWWLSGGAGGWQKLNTSSATLGSVAFGDFNGDGKTDVFRADGTNFLVSYGGTGSWTTLSASPHAFSELRFGDFNGDGKTDVFRADGTTWWWRSGGAGSWQALNSSGVTVANLAIGDFNGDGKADVFRANGTNFSVSYGGTGSWTTLNTSSYGLSVLRFGDFDGDGKTDVLRPDGTRWNVSWGGTSAWKTLAVASEDLSQFALGDFDGDGTTDAFRTGCL